MLTGMLSPALLVAVEGDEFGNVLPVAAAASWARLRAGVRDRYGWTPVLSGGGCGYRPYAVQERIFRQRYTAEVLPGRPSKSWLGRRWFLRPGMATAAVPGMSNHGTEKGAVDVAHLGGFQGAAYRQFALVASEHGWTNTEGRTIGEAWHWVRDGYDRHVPTVRPPVKRPAPTPDVEDDMYTDADRARDANTAVDVAECRRMLGVLLGYNTPANDIENRARDGLWAGGESRRMLGVILGWEPPKGPELDGLAQLRAGS